jgi:hypothetical protein
MQKDRDYEIRVKDVRIERDIPSEFEEDRVDEEHSCDACISLDEADPLDPLG